jgi:hypothetical protein
MNEAKTAVKKTLSFDNSLTGKITIDREVLVKNIETEHRSYGNHPCTIEGNSKFNLPELSTRLPQGFKLGVVVYIPDNSKGDSNKKEVMSL